MDVVQREVPPDVADVGEVLEQVPHDRLGHAAVRDTRSRRTRRRVTGASTGPRTWSRSGSTSRYRSTSGSAVAEQGADASAPGKQRGRAEEQPREQRRATSAAAEDPDLRFVELAARRRRASR